MRVLIGPQQAIYAGIRAALVRHQSLFLGFAGQGDIEYRYNEDTLQSILERVPSGWSPEAFVWYNAEYFAIPRGLRDLPCLTVAVVGDWNQRFTFVLDALREFDLVLTDKRGVRLFTACGLERVAYLPAYSFDPALVLPAGGARDIDIGIACNLNHAAQRERAVWLRRVAQLDGRFTVRITSGVHGADYAAFLGRTKITFNRSIRGEMNLRCYEGPAGGSLLFVEEENEEVREFLQPGVECVLYNERNLEQLLEFYLTHEEERAAIAAAGQAKILQHSYADHFELLVKEIEACQAAGGRSARGKERVGHRRTAAHAVQVISASPPEASVSGLLFWQEALEEDPENAEYWNGVGVAYLDLLDLGRTDPRAAEWQRSAEAAFERARALRRDYLLPLLNLGNLYSGIKPDPTRASGIYRGVLALLDREEQSGVSYDGALGPADFSTLTVEWQRIHCAGVGDRPGLRCALRRLIEWVTCERLGMLGLCEIEERMALLRRSACARPDLAGAACAQLAVLRARADDFVGACADAERATRVEPLMKSFAELHWGLLRRVGRESEAVAAEEEWQKVARSCSVFRDA